MSQKVQKTIEINAKVKTSLEDMSKTIRQLEDGLSKQKFDLGKTSGLSKLIKDYKEAKTELDELMQGDQIARADIKKAENLGDKVSKLYKKIATSFKELQGGNEEVFKNLFPSKFVTQITKGTQAIDKFFQKLDTKGIKTTKVDDLTKEVQTLETELSQLKNRRIKVEIDVDKEKVSKELQRINNEFDNMRQNFKKKLFPDEGKDSKGRTTTQKLDSSVATWSNKLAQDREARKNLKVADLTKAQKTQITKLEGQLTDSAGSSLIENEKKRLQALQAEQRKRETIAKTPGARDTSRSRREYGGVADKELSTQIAASEKELQRLKAIADKIEDIRQQPQKAYDAAVKNLETRIKTDRTNLEKAEKALAEHQTRREEEEKIATQKTEDFMSGKSTAEATQEEIEALKKLNQERQEAINLEKKLKQEESFKSQESKDSAISKKESTIANKRREIEALSNEIKNLTNETNLDEFFQKLGELGVNTEGIEHTHEGLEQIRKDLKDLNAQTTEAIRKQLLELGYDSQEADKMVDALGKGMEELGDKDKDLSRAENEMENLKNQVLQFFSITNSIQLFKRAVMSALNTVKELDATMTEAAVVTDFSVGDMWDKLPEYSANAQKLGVSINGMYQATTLYYQQGLKTNEAMALGIETMKMGKIASMDSTESTKAMTAALRGFNMELNETSATRVNDVYSQLAAVTAADTNQIATAMEKTASIAAAANMEFETTAALLAQIIETTQEAPETAGTALKTIIARFSEVKSLQNEGKATGTDAEGETIDVNKIQTALRTVGISMEGFFQGTEGLDSILLKLAEKWNTLDFQTQHYVATMAAGSRQQSRFIAMMSDYKRTTELVGEAQDSAGASQRQFNKTQDSMESKLQRLENAWNEFLMGLSNNEVLKGAIDVLTFLIENINGLTEALSGGDGLVKSFISLITVIGGLKIGKNVLGNIFGWTGQQMGLKPQQNGGQGTEPKIIPNPGQSGGKAGQSWAAGFLGSALKKLDHGKHSIEETTDNLTSKKGKKGKYLRDKTKQQKDPNKIRDTSITDKTKTNEQQIDDLSNKANSAAGSMEKMGNAAQGAGDKVQATGQKAQETGGKIEETEVKTSNLSTGMYAVGGAAVAIGSALSLLSSYFGSLGMEEAAETASTLSTIFTGFGMVLIILPGLIDGVATVAAKAGMKVWAAWMWLGVILAIVSLLIVAVVKLCKAWEEASGTAQLERMNEQLADLSAAADEAKQKLEDMASAKEDLENMQDAFKGLIKGSREWKQALIENNQKVLELINTYPQLAGEVSKGIHGELTISEEGWNQAMEQQQQIYTDTLGAKTAMTQQAQEKEQYIQTEHLMSDKVGMGVRKDTADFLDSDSGKWAVGLSGAALGAAAGAAIGSAVPIVGTIIGGLLGAGVGLLASDLMAEEPEEVEQEQTGGLTYDEFNKFAALAADRGYSMAEGNLDNAAAENLLSELGYDVKVENMEAFMSNLNSMGVAFDELANSAMAVSMAERARVDSIAASVAQTSAIVQGSKEFGAVAEEMGSQALTGYDDKVAERADKYLNDMDVWDKNLDEGAAAEAITKYAKIQGIDEAEVRRQIENEEITKETIANVIAAQEVNEEMKAAMEGTVKVLERVTKNKTSKEANELKSLMTDRGAGLNVGAVTNIEKAGSMEEYLIKQGFNTKDAKAMGYTKINEQGQVVGDWDAYVRAMESNYQTGIAAFENIRVQVEKTGLSFESLPDTLTAGTAQGLANKLSMVAANEGTAMAQQVLSTYEGITEGLSAEQVQLFTQYMTDIDWSNIDEVEEFQKQMEELGMNIPDKQLDTLISQMIEFGNATKELTFEEVNAKIRQNQNLIKDIESGDQGRSFTKEQYDFIVEHMPEEKENFQEDVDGTYYYVADSLDNLIDALRQNTAALLGKTQDQMTAKYMAADILTKEHYFGTAGNKTSLDELKEKINTTEEDVYTNQIGETTNQLASALTDFQNWANNDNIDLSLLGIEGLTNNTDFNLLTHEERQRIAGELIDIGANKEYYQEQSGYDEEGEKHKAEVAKYIGYETHAIAPGTDGQTYMYFDPNSMLSQIKQWAEVYGVDMSKYQDIYSSDTDTSQQAAYELFSDFNNRHSSYDYVANDIYNQEEPLKEHHFNMAARITGQDAADLRTQYETGVLDREALANSMWNVMNTLPNGQSFMDFMYGTSNSNFADVDVTAQHAGLEQYAGGQKYQNTPLEERPERYQQSLGNNYKGFTDNTFQASYEITDTQADALETLAARYGIFGKVLQDFKEAMGGANEEQKRSTAAALANEIEQKRQEKTYGKTLKTLGDVYDEYANVSKGMQGYSQAVNTYGEALNLDMDIADNYEFVAENMELIQQAAQGNIDSILKLNQLLAAEHGLVITADGNFDLYNSAVDVADAKTQQFIMDQYAAGAYEVVEEEVDQTMDYLAPIYDANGMVTGFERKTAQAGQTIQMLRPQDAPSIERAQSYGGAPTGGGGGGGGGGGKWENPYDKLHNVLEEINDLLREREKLERRYQRLVDQGTATAENLSRISNDNVSNYQDEIAKQEYIIAGRKAQVQAKIKANPDMEKYVYTDVDAMGNETIRIDWDAINAITDSEEGEKVSAFYDDIDEWLESIYDAEESILEAEDGIWEELQQGKDEYLDLEEQVKEAIVNQRQEEIDKLSAINDSINDTNSRLLEAMQSSIDKYRQDRENQKTEEELSDKQRRLAYLQQDTSGANDLEIMKLQEEIDQGQQDYTDSLIDQKISELQEQNDKAAEQRQQQIDIMQAQLDKYVESGEIWQEVSDLIATGTDAAQNLVKGSELETLLKSSAGFEGMSNVQKMAWLQDTNVLIAQALKWLSDGAVSSFSTGQEVTFKTGDGKTITGKANAQGEVEADGQIYKDVSMDAYGNYSTKETVEDAKNEYTHRAEEKKKADEEAAFNARFPFGRPSDISRNLWRGHSGTDVKALQQALNELGFNAGEVDGIFGGQTWSALTKFKNKYGGHGEYGMQSKTKAAFKAIEYKTGGLADFTGPAWLDGTRSKPEYILNADQTKAFFTLVDVLGSLQAGNSKTAQNSGDNTYDIDINVESIGSDYDVEQLATTVKRLINEDARYRNNNAINLMR